MKKERVAELLRNFIIYIDYEILQHLTLDEKLELLKEEIGFTDEEIKELDIIERCLK